MYKKVILKLKPKIGEVLNKVGTELRDKTRNWFSIKNMD